MHRHAHVKSRLGELEKIKAEHLRQRHASLARGFTDQQPLTPQTPLTPGQQREAKVRDPQL